jgi:hypothetical protein
MKRYKSRAQLLDTVASVSTSDVISDDNGAGTSARRVYVASDRQLRRKSHFQRLAIATAALGVSRRELINVLSDAIYGFDGQLYWPEGDPYEIPDVDDVFGDDGSFRWVSDFIRFAEKSPRQVPQGRIVERLRFIDLYFRIKHPERARLIAE